MIDFQVEEPTSLYVLYDLFDSFLNMISIMVYITGAAYSKESRTLCSSRCVNLSLKFLHYTVLNMVL